jgi:hypothetical protein
MPIVQTGKAVEIQANGNQQVVVRHIDQDGKEYMYTFNAKPEVNVDAIIADRIVLLDEQLAQQEFEAIIGEEVV